MKAFFLFVGLTLCFSLTSFTQGKNQRVVGCHHKHHSGPILKNLSSGDREQLNASIARSDTFDILSYIIHIDVTNYSGAYIKAATTIALKPKMSDQEFVRFDLLNLQVDSVKLADTHLAYEYDSTILKVNFQEVPSLNDTLNVTVFYQGNPHRDPIWGGFYFESNYIYNLGIGISTIPPNFGKVWYPCFDSFVERATYEYHVKSAGAFKAHCQGTFLGEVQLAGDTVIRSFALDLEIPTHLSAIAVADYQNTDFIHEGNYEDIPVRFTGKPAQMNSMNNALQNIGAAIDACEHWYGPYIWGRVGYVLTTDGALEIPTNIAYPQYMVGQSISANNRLMSHELGHHWWGDVVTPYNHNDMWLKEGPAEYSAHLMEEWLNGENAFVDMVKTNHLDVMLNAHLDDDGYHPLSPMPDEHIYGTHTYNKGASVMHNLRGYLRDDLFKLGMSTVQQTRHFQTVTPEEFRDELEEATGYNLHSFFDDQVFKPGFSVFVVDSFEVSTAAGGGYNTTINIQQKLRACPSYYTNVPLDISLIGADYQRSEHIVSASGQLSEVSVYSNFIPVMVVINGKNRLNQARMDYEFISRNGVLPSTPALPYVDFRLYQTTVADTSLVRVEHIWAKPDPSPLGPGIFEISDSHYWIVDGIWNSQDLFQAELNYVGNNVNSFDYTLYNTTEANAVLVYRPNSSEPWRVYTDFQLNAGQLMDGIGVFRIPLLRKGQYAFAKGDQSVSDNSLPQNEQANIVLYPVPAKDQLTIKGRYNGLETALIDITSTDGKIVSRSSMVVENSYSKNIDISSLSAGNYILTIQTVKGENLGVKQFGIK